MRISVRASASDLSLNVLTNDCRAHAARCRTDIFRVSVASLQSASQYKSRVAHEFFPVSFVPRARIDVKRGRTARTERSVVENRFGKVRARPFYYFRNARNTIRTGVRVRVSNDNGKAVAFLFFPFFPKVSSDRFSVVESDRSRRRIRRHSVPNKTFFAFAVPSCVPYTSANLPASGPVHVAVAFRLLRPCAFTPRERLHSVARERRLVLSSSPFKRAPPDCVYGRPILSAESEPDRCSPRVRTTIEGPDVRVDFNYINYYFTLV